MNVTQGRIVRFLTVLLPFLFMLGVKLVATANHWINVDRDPLGQGVEWMALIVVTILVLMLGLLILLLVIAVGMWIWTGRWPQ